MTSELKELLHSENPQDALLALLMDLDSCIEIMNKVEGDNFWLKTYDINKSKTSSFYWCKIKGKMIGFRPKDFIGLIRPEKERYYRETHPELLIYE